MIQKLNEKKNEKGFTLIELMIVIAIIGILSAIAIPNFLSYRERGMNSAGETTANNFMSLAMAYFADTGNLGTFDGSTGSVPGFQLGDGVVNSGAGIQFTGAGVLTDASAVTFQHSNGTLTFTVEGDANNNPTVTEGTP